MKSSTIRGHSGSHALRFIAGLKLGEAMLLLSAGVAALGLLDANWQRILARWLTELCLQEGRRLTSHLAEGAIAALGTITPGRLSLAAIGCFAYASVFLGEAVGLWLHKRWGTYLTSVATASLLPIEASGVWHQPTMLRICTLVINLLIVGYLVWNLIAQRQKLAGRPSTRI